MSTGKVVPFPRPTPPPAPPLPPVEIDTSRDDGGLTITIRTP